MARLWILMEVAAHHFGCDACTGWLRSRGSQRKPCKRTLRMAEAIDADLLAAEEPTAQESEREPDPDEDEEVPPIRSIDQANDCQVIGDLIFRREQQEKAAAATRREVQRLRSRPASRQQRSPAA